jgi:hypothetical protein
MEGGIIWDWESGDFIGGKGKGGAGARGAPA